MSMIWSFLAGAASMFAVLFVLSLWAGLHYAKKAKASVALNRGGAAEPAQAAQHKAAATTAFADPTALIGGDWQRPLGATPYDFRRRTYVVFDQTIRPLKVIGTLVAVDVEVAMALAEAVYGSRFVVRYSSCSIEMMQAADELDERADRAAREHYA